MTRHADRTTYVRRADHFFGECLRVLMGVDLWSAGNLAEFGALMKQSSWSSLHNYEVRLSFSQCTAVAFEPPVHARC